MDYEMHYDNNINIFVFMFSMSINIENNCA